jgi:hypothetical protein
MQKEVCPLCRGEPLTNDGKVTHIDHVVTVEVFADKVFHGELTFDDVLIASCGRIPIFARLIADAITPEKPW